MRDGVNLVQRGIPAAVVVHDVFESAARAQARTTGVPDLPIIVYPQATSREEQLAALRAAAEEVALKLAQTLQASPKGATV